MSKPTFGNTCPFLILKFSEDPKKRKSNVKMNTTSIAEQLRAKEHLLDALQIQRDNCTNRNATNEELTTLTARIMEVAKEANALKKINNMSNSSNQQQQQLTQSSSACILTQSCVSKS